MPLRPLLLAGLVWLALAAAGCGGETTDVSAGVTNLNGLSSKRDIQFDCPDEVDGGEGTEFDCTVKNTKTRKMASVKLKVVKEDGDLAVDFADKAAGEAVEGVAS